MPAIIYMQVSFAIIATVSLASNALFCVVILRDQRLRNTAYNALLLSLAITDMLTGFSLLITPENVIDASKFTIPGGALGDFFCRVIYSQLLVFTLGIVSVYTLTFLAVERWYAITRPHKYKGLFGSRLKHVYVAVVWVISCLLNSPHALEMELVTQNASVHKCEWITTITDENARRGVAVVEFLFKFLLPVLVTCSTFLHLNHTVRKPGCQFLRTNGRERLRLLRMCTITAFALALCWAPNQISYLLFKFDLTRNDGPGHYSTIIICMSNSCINPWLYCATNPTYRRKFEELLCCRASHVVSDVTTSGTGDEQSTEPTNGLGCHDNESLTFNNAAGRMSPRGEPSIMNMELNFEPVKAGNTE